MKNEDVIFLGEFIFASGLQTPTGYIFLQGVKLLFALSPIVTLPKGGLL